MFFQFKANHHAVINLLGLPTMLVLPLARVPLLKLSKQGAQIVLPNCACHSAQIGHLAQIGPDLYSNAAVQESQLWDCYQPALSKVVLNRDCAVQKRAVVRL